MGMKKLDKLIIRSFLGPFILTFLVVVFILLIQYMLKYFEDFVGKGLGVGVFSELLFYFSVNMTPVAMPLAILLSSLMTFGTLGEHNELTAIKSAGISLPRILLPVMTFVLFISFVAFVNNNYIVPRANLNAYSLLYDIKQKKPSLDLREGAFYSGIPNYSIKVNKKYPDGVTLKDIIIYDHTKGLGNMDVILADSGRMFVFNNDRYLKLELFNGKNFSELSDRESYSQRSRHNHIKQFVRSKFYKTTMVFSLASFQLERTDKTYFASNRLMRNVDQLKSDVDSMKLEFQSIKHSTYQNSVQSFSYFLKKDVQLTPEIKEYVDQDSNMMYSSPFSDINIKRKLVEDSVAAVNAKTITFNKAKYDSLIKAKKVANNIILTQAASMARFSKSNFSIDAQRVKDKVKDINTYSVELLKKYSLAISCFIMFLIGAPLGAIIKKGGLGVPVIVSIAFFIVFYVISMMGEKWAKQGLITPEVGVWAANAILLPFGFVFMIQAKNDARLFETDYYKVMIDRINSFYKNFFKRRRRSTLVARV